LSNKNYLGCTIIIFINGMYLSTFDCIQLYDIDVKNEDKSRPVKEGDANDLMLANPVGNILVL
jgi:hypothetical protein